jgi:protein involved in polysaccharide export with SLBB domain
MKKLISLSACRQLDFIVVERRALRAAGALGVATALLILLCGCQHPRNTGGPQFSNLNLQQSGAVTLTNQLSPELLRPQPTPFTLGPGDRLEIELLNQPKSRATTFVGPDGKVYYHLLPGIDVWGLTLNQARAVLEKEMAKYVTEPQIAVTLREASSKHIWLLGRLTRPGVYPLTAPTTLLESIATAGGAAHSTSQVTTEELADLRHCFVMRQGQFLPVDFYRLLREGDTSQNIYLQPDDFVYVPSALSQQIYVLGAVAFPRAVPYTEGMTMVGAIAGASGPVTLEWLAQNNLGLQPDAYLSHIVIVRGSLAQPQMIVGDYSAIIKGRERDVPLEPGDIVYVPNAPLSTLKRYFNLAVNTFITTVFANEGIRAGGGQVSVGVSVPVGPR